MTLGAATVPPLGAPSPPGAVADQAKAAIGEIWVYLFLAALGLAVSLAALFYASRIRQRPLALAQAVGGGGIASTIAGVLSTKVAGLSAAWTYAEVAVFVGFWFILGLFLWLIVFGIATHTIIIRPVRRRYGRVFAMKAWLEFFGGVETLRQWIRDALVTLSADEAWDEFACAALDVHSVFSGGEAEAEIALGALAFVAERDGQQAALEDAMNIVRAALEEPVQMLAARLTHTTLNFTVWRIHPTRESLEHLASFPADSGREAGYPARGLLPIWGNTGKSCSGSFAADVMFRRMYEVKTEDDWPRHWERRELGRKYEAVASMPIPCDGGSSPVWGVICVESREGTIPLGSKSMRLLVGAIARVIDQARPLVAVRGLSDGAIVPMPHAPIYSPRPAQEASERGTGAAPTTTVPADPSGTRAAGAEAVPASTNGHAENQPPTTVR